MGINTIIIERPELAIEMVLPVKAATVIEAGSIVSVDTAIGYALPAAPIAGYSFMGIAQEDVDNTLGANGAKTVRVKCPKVMRTPVVGTVLATDLGKVAYANGPYGVAAITGSVSTNVRACGKIIGLVDAWGYVVEIIPNIGQGA